MSNIIQFPVIAGVEITTDEHGRFNLNALHRASGLGDHKAPNQWLRHKQAKELIDELESQTANSQSAQSAVNVVNGGTTPGTFAHELLAIEYAGWISPKFRLLVNQTFIDYKTGKLAPAVEMTKLEILQMAIESEKERMRLEAANQAMLPKAKFHDKVVAAPDAISVSEAAKVLNTGRRRLFAYLRQIGWVTRKNEPYQDKINAGLLDVKLGNWEHPDHGLQQSVTALVTGKGLAKLRELMDQNDAA